MPSPPQHPLAARRPPVLLTLRYATGSNPPFRDWTLLRRYSCHGCYASFRCMLVVQIITPKAVPPAAVAKQYHRRGVCLVSFILSYVFGGFQLQVPPHLGNAEVPPTRRVLNPSGGLHTQKQCRERGRGWGGGTPGTRIMQHQTDAIRCCLQGMPDMFLLLP